MSEACLHRHRLHQFTVRAENQPTGREVYHFIARVVIQLTFMDCKPVSGMDNKLVYILGGNLLYFLNC